MFIKASNCENGLIKLLTVAHGMYLVNKPRNLKLNPAKLKWLIWIFLLWNIFIDENIGTYEYIQITLNTLYSHSKSVNKSTNYW